jgi:hypothetical protein
MYHHFFTHLSLPLVVHSVTGIWYLPYDEDNKDSFYIVVSFALETRVLSSKLHRLSHISAYQGGSDQLRIYALIHRCRSGNAGCF